MSFETYLKCCVVLVVAAQLADLAHAWWCERRSRRRFEAAMRRPRLRAEAAAGEVA